MMPWLKLATAIAVIWWLGPKRPASLIGISVEGGDGSAPVYGGDGKPLGWL